MILETSKPETTISKQHCHLPTTSCREEGNKSHLSLQKTREVQIMPQNEKMTHLLAVFTVVNSSNLPPRAQLSHAL